MADRFQQKRDFGQKKRAVTMAGTAVKNFIAAYESIDAKAITDHEEAEEMLKKIKHLKRTVDQYQECVLKHEDDIVNLARTCEANGTEFDTKWDDDFKEVSKDFEKYKAEAQIIVCDAMGFVADYLSSKGAGHRTPRKNLDGTVLADVSRSEKSDRKFTNVLAPEKLEHNASLQTFVAFETKFRAHHDINCLENYEFSQREAFLMNLLDDVLINKVKIHFKNQIYYNIFHDATQPETPSILGFLKRHFEIQDPLLVRRFRYFSSKQKSGETDIQYLERIKKLELEAEASTLTPQQTFVAILMNGSSNTDLKRQVLKLGQRPGIDQIETLYRQYEEVNVMNRAIRPHSASAHEISDAEINFVSNYRRNIRDNLQGRGRPNVRHQSGRGRGYQSFQIGRAHV